MKIVVNRCYGGFQLSDEAMERLGLPLTFGDEIAAGKWFLKDSNILGNDDLGISSEQQYAHRTDPRLIALVEELGTGRASGRCAELKVVEIPNGVDWKIEQYDGREWVAEVHRTW